MGGLWVDYNLMSTIPGLFVLGEANFSDHGANRLGASALMQGLSDGYFVIPYTIGNYLATNKLDKVDAIHARSPSRPSTTSRPSSNACSPSRASAPSHSFHRELGTHHVGLLRHVPQRRRPRRRHRQDPRAARRVLARTSTSPAPATNFNQQLENAGRVADFFELAELMCLDALRSQRKLRRPLPRRVPDPRRRSPARRRELLLRGRLGVCNGADSLPALNKEPLEFDYVHPEPAELQIG